MAAQANFEQMQVLCATGGKQISTFVVQWLMQLTQIIGILAKVKSAIAEANITLVIGDQIWPTSKA